MAESTNVSYSYAVLSEQGIGFSENSGSDWVFPQAKTEPITVFDNDGLPHTLVICNKDGLIYDMAGRDGPTSSSLARNTKDKVDTDDSGGTDILGELTFPEDTGTYEDFFIESLQAHIFVEPYDNSSGYPSGLQLDIEIYANGEPTTYSARAENIPKQGDIYFDRKVNAHRLQLKLKSNMGGHIVRGLRQELKSQDVAAEPANTKSTEKTYQKTIGTVLSWLLPWKSLPYDRANGTSFSSGYDSLTTDPTSKTNALNFTASDSGLTLNSKTLSADFKISFWLSTITAPVTILSIGDCSISITESSGVYTITFTDGTNTKTQQLNWANSGWVLLSIERSGSNIIFREGYEA